MSPRDVGVAEELAQDATVAALDSLATLRRNEEAIREFVRAAALTRHESARGLLRRAARVVDGSAENSLFRPCLGGIGSVGRHHPAA